MGATLRIVNSTLSGNSANDSGGGIFSDVDAMLEIGDTILKAGASGANIVNNSGTVTSRGYNLSSDDGGGLLTATGDQINTDPMVGPLQDNGGPTWTHALLPGSPAIDKGTAISGFNYDRDGKTRPDGAAWDIGAYETDGTPPNAPTNLPRS